MVDAQRALLDELMGVDRDAPPAARAARPIRVDDPDVCKLALAGLCPHGLFKNTKSDLGPCRWRRHEEWGGWASVADAWTSLPPADRARYGYEADLHALLDGMVRDMDRKIERARERLAASAAAARAAIPQADLDHVASLRAQANAAVQAGESAAASGDADAAVDATRQADKAAAGADTADAALARRAPPAQTVCTVCGIQLAVNEPEARVKEHVEGKQYVGWSAVRARLAELRKEGVPLGGRGGGVGAPAADAGFGVRWQVRRPAGRWWWARVQGARA